MTPGATFSIGAVSFDGALAVDGVAQRIHDPAEQGLADRHFENAAGALDGVALAQVLVVAQDHSTHRVPLQVQRQAEGVAREFQHLALHGVRQAVDPRDAVVQADDRAFGARLGRAFEFLDPLFNQVADFRWIQLGRHGLFL